MTKSQKPRPVALATVASKLDIRPGIVKALMKSGILEPLRSKLLIFDPKAACEGIISRSGNPALIEKAQEWLSRLEAEPQLLAVKPNPKKRTNR
jgi:hypothetical protein